MKEFKKKKKGEYVGDTPRIKALHLDGETGLEICEYGLGIRHADHVVPSIRKSWHQLRQQAAVARSV
jgi:hypothetical protein